MMAATLMVHVPPGHDNGSLLQFAGDAAEKVQARKLIGIAALQPLQVYAGPEAYVPPDLFQQDWEAMERELAAGEAAFRAAFAGMPVQLEWRCSIGTGLPADYVAEQLRAADMIITPARPTGIRFDRTRYMDTADVVLKAGRPVLVAGAGVTKLDLTTVMVAWKDGREARRAAGDAVPLLRMAGKVLVVEVVDERELVPAETRLKDVVGWLAAHGVTAEARAERGRDEDAVILSLLADDLKAGMVVGGAYGHTRLREWVLGGVTRDLLLRPVQCSLLSH